MNHASIGLIRFLILGCLFWQSERVADAQAVESSDVISVYFYNPETNINNFSSLKSAFEHYLGKLGAVEFHPFDDQFRFENVIGERKNALFLLSSWHFRLLEKHKPIVPVLVGISHGRVHQRKILSSKLSPAEVSQMERLRVASSAGEAYSRAELGQILSPLKIIPVTRIKLILVPKDIDALMAVGFGLADAALTTEASLKGFSAINAKLQGQLTSLGMSEQHFLTLAAVPDNASPSLAPLIDFLTKTSADQHALNLLGLDGMRKLTPLEYEALK